MAGYDGKSKDACKTCGAPPWESCARYSGSCERYKEAFKMQQAGYDVGFGAIRTGDTAALYNDGNFVREVRVTDVTQDGDVSWIAPGVSGLPHGTTKWAYVRSLAWHQRNQVGITTQESKSAGHLLMDSGEETSKPDFYTVFGLKHNMTRGAAKLYVLEQLYGKDYESGPDDPRGDDLRDALLAALQAYRP